LDREVLSVSTFYDADAPLVDPAISNEIILDARGIRLCFTVSGVSTLFAVVDHDCRVHGRISHQLVAEIIETGCQVFTIHILELIKYRAICSCRKQVAAHYE
jgi:hypothetical protein